MVGVTTTGTIVVHVVGRINGLHKGLAQISKGPAAVAHHNRPTAMVGDDALQLAGDKGKCLIPGNFPPLPFPSLAHAQQGSKRALLVIALGQGCPAFGAEAVSHGRIIGVAFNPCGFAVFYMH